MVAWWRSVAVLVGLVIAGGGLVALAGGASAAPNDPPLADAGLDQTVANGSTVYLDAGGSVDPDGSITEFQWTITAPDGSTVTSPCDSCTETSFTPDQLGQYSVQVDVTDDDGATRTDTLYVTVEPPSGPSVDLSGPATTTVGTATDFTVTATADERDLDRLVWFRNGSREAESDLAGDQTDRTLTRSFDETGTYRLRASVVDDGGYSRDAVLTLEVGPDRSERDFDPCPDGGRQVWVDDESTWRCYENAQNAVDGMIHLVSHGGQRDLAHEGKIRYETEAGEIYTMDRDDAVEQGVMEEDSLLVDRQDLLDQGRRITRTENEIAQYHSGAVDDSDHADSGSGSVAPTYAYIKATVQQDDIEQDNDSSNWGQGSSNSPAGRSGHTNDSDDDEDGDDDSHGSNGGNCPSTVCSGGGYP